MSTRRKFLLDCSAIAVTASVAPATALGASLRLKEVSLERISFQTFYGHLKAVFLVQGDSGSRVALRLAEVRSTPAYPAATLAAAEDAGNEKFSLLFSGLPKRPLEQGSYWFEHKSMGRFALFIVPIGPADGRHCLYEAVFNRSVNGPLPQAGEGNIPLGRARNKRRPAAEADSNGGNTNLN